MMIEAHAHAHHHPHPHIKFRPLEDRLVVKRAVADEKTAGGIIIPDAHAVKPQEGIVLAVGPGKLLPKKGGREPIGLEVGQRVLFGQWSGEPVVIEGHDVLILHGHEIIGILS